MEAESHLSPFLNLALWDVGRGQKWSCLCYHKRHLQQIHRNKIFRRMYGLGLMLNMTTPKVWEKIKCSIIVRQKLVIPATVKELKPHIKGYLWGFVIRLYIKLRNCSWKVHKKYKDHISNIMLRELIENWPLMISGFDSSFFDATRKIYRKIKSPSDR